MLRRGAAIAPRPPDQGHRVIGQGHAVSGCFGLFRAVSGRRTRQTVYGMVFRPMQTWYTRVMAYSCSRDSPQGLQLQGRELT